MSMSNKDMPAMPVMVRKQVDGSGNCLHMDHVDYGLTKREMFAMNAPDTPEWFKFDWETKNSHNKNYMTGFGGRILPKGEMTLLKAWRYAYADMMLED